MVIQLQSIQQSQRLVRRVTDTSAVRWAHSPRSSRKRGVPADDASVGSIRRLPIFSVTSPRRCEMQHEDELESQVRFRADQ
jgi:hypothetical protein